MVNGWYGYRDQELDHLLSVQRCMATYVNMYGHTSDLQVYLFLHVDIDMCIYIYIYVHSKYDDIQYDVYQSV